MKEKFLAMMGCLLAPLFFIQTALAQQSVASPDKAIRVLVWVDQAGHALYKVYHHKSEVLAASALGVKADKAVFSEGLQLKPARPVAIIKDAYTLFNAKKSHITYIANKRIFTFSNKAGNIMEVIFQVSDDGVAFRYHFPGSKGDTMKVEKELSAYHFPVGTRAFLQPKAIAGTGWEHTNPSYEEAYLQDIPVGTPSPLAGWVYPALFKQQKNWLLITETGMTGDYAATHLENDSAGSEYRVSFPNKREVFDGGGLLPKGALPWYTPWRIITIGSLRTIATSTLGTDLAIPAATKDWSFVHPGKSSWSWINSKDDSIVGSEQIRYIDFAADMRWQYCLIDVNWDKKIGYNKIKELADYARAKNVGLLLWYNSAGGWNTVPYTPKGLLLTHNSREKEFARLEAMGIKGVKIDFFNGDGQSMIKYYTEILNDAARHKLLVNFHGATLPRGWARTYPHLMTTEAVKGFEMVTFEQKVADVEANHCAMLPFTRNAFDPMDFTPMNLYRINSSVQRKTTGGFELATSVLFLSGIQHFAESPGGMARVPGFVKSFLQTLPTHWDDLKFLDGYPGKLAVVARRKGGKWYIAGINGEALEKKIVLDLSWLNGRVGNIISDGKEASAFSRKQVLADRAVTITLKPNGGFVISF
jgi:hypothetical protein